MTTGTTLWPEMELSLRPSLPPSSSQAWPQAYSISTPVGNGSCIHSSEALIKWETIFCGLCFMREGYAYELPGRLHLTRTLADNGNPQQTGQLEGHVSIVEGLKPPPLDMPLRHFSRARGQLRSRPLPLLFPFASSVWEVMGKQPPLGIPLAYFVTGASEFYIARTMDISLYSVNERLGKAVRMATKLIKGYDGRRNSHQAAEYSSDQT